MRSADFSVFIYVRNAGGLLQIWQRGWPRQTHGVGFDFVRRLRADGTHLRILGDGRQDKSYIHVSDVIDIVMWAHSHCKEDFEVFNVATGDTITVSEIADLCCEVVGLAPGKVKYDYAGGDRGWKGDVPVGSGTV